MLLDSDKNRVRHMVEAAEEALEYLHERAAVDVKSDRPLQHLLVRNIEILGEAASRVSPALRSAHPEVPWRDMIAMRNRLIHAYSDININVIWSTVHHALPQLLEQLEAILERSEPDT